MSWQRIDGSGDALHPWVGLTIQPPRGCIGALRLHNQQAARHRDPALGNLPAKTTQRLRPVSLSTPTTGDSGLSVIEFRFGLSECPADINADGELDGDDFFLFLDLFGEDDPSVDFNHDGTIDSADFFAYLDIFVHGC